MASSSLTLYKNNTQSDVFTLASQNAAGANYLVAGRSLSAPKAISVNRKINANASANDKISTKFIHTELNATTGKPATFSIDVIISIPKDTSNLTPTIQKEGCAIVSSLLNDGTAMAATAVNRTALIEGRDL